MHIVQNLCPCMFGAERNVANQIADSSIQVTNNLTIFALKKGSTFFQIGLLIAQNCGKEPSPLNRGIN